MGFLSQFDSLGLGRLAAEEGLTKMIAGLGHIQRQERL